MGPDSERPWNKSSVILWETLPRGPSLLDVNCSTCDLDFWDVSPDDWIVKDTWEVTLKVSVMVAICFIGIVGNVSIIAIIQKNKLLRLNRSNLFLLNMCVSDCLNLIFNPVLYLFKQGVIFKFYYLGDFMCNVSPFLIVAFMLASVLSLTNISLNRLLGITVARFQDKQSSLVTVLILIGVTWAIALTAAIPTTIFRHYWERQWINLVETNCDDRAAAAEPMRAYWLVLLGLLVWVPTIIMVVSYALIFYHLRVSMQKFPYMSAQSQAMRSRQKVIRTLCLLLGVQIVSWFPWQFFTLYDSFVLFQNNGSFDPDSIYTHKIGPILYDIKYYFVFMGSALNPILYGYRSAFMRRAFMVTFPCLFKRKSNYEIIRTNNGHRSTVLFRKVEIKKNSRISKTIFDQGMLSMAPVVAHWVLTNSLQKNDANQYGLGSERKRPSRVLPSSVRRHLGGTIQKSHSTGQIRDSIHKSRSQKFENGLGRPRDFVFQNSVPNPEKSTISIPNSVTQATQGLLNIPNKIKRKLSVTSSKADESPILILMRKESVASDISPQLGPQLRITYKDYAPPANVRHVTKEILVPQSKQHWEGPEKKLSNILHRRRNTQ